MVITDLEHLELLNASVHTLAGAGRRMISLSLSQGVLLLTLDGKELLKTTLPDSPSDFSMAIGASKFWRLCQLQKTNFSSSSITMQGSRARAAIYAFASSSTGFSPAP